MTWYYLASFVGAFFCGAGMAATVTFLLCRSTYEKHLLSLRIERDGEAKWADEYHHKLMLCHKALKELLADVEDVCDMGLPFSDPEHCMHRSWTLAKGAAEMEI